MFSFFARQRWTSKTSAALLSCYGAYSITSMLQRRSLLDELPQPVLSPSEKNTKVERLARTSRKEAAKAAEDFCAFADSSPSGKSSRVMTFQYLRTDTLSFSLSRHRNSKRASSLATLHRNPRKRKLVHHHQTSRKILPNAK